MLAAISQAKNELLDEDQYERRQQFYTRTVARVYKSYQERLRLHTLDFDDLLFYVVKLRGTTCSIKSLSAKISLYFG